jgi:Uma2 family endonuclease
MDIVLIPTLERWNAYRDAPASLLIKKTMQTAPQPLSLKTKEIYYPDTDGKPMADNDFQRKPLTYLIEALDYAFREQPNVYVSGDLLIYYEKDNPQASVAPDVFVIFNVPKQDRRIYQTWIEGKTPDVVFEIASYSTYKKDETVKLTLYQQLGVQEYFQYDPTGNYLQPALKGHFLDKNGHYQEMMSRQLENNILVITSHRLLGLELHLEKGELRIFNPQTQEYLYTYSEEAAARRAAEKESKRERKQKEWAQQEAKQQQQRAEKLAEQLRALGINPDELK